MAKKKAAKKKTVKVSEIVAIVETKLNQNGCAYWRLVAHNREILAVSESYSSYEKCEQTAKKIAKQLKVRLLETIAWSSLDERQD